MSTSLLYYGFGIQGYQHVHPGFHAAPDQIVVVDVQVLQVIGKNLMVGMRPAQIGLGVNHLQPHEPHQPRHPPSG